MNDSTISLARIRCGQCARLEALGTDARQADRLRALGLCEGRTVVVLRTGERLIVRVGGCRLGLHRGIAERVSVIPDDAPEPVRRSWPESLLSRLRRR